MIYALFNAVCVSLQLHKYIVKHSLAYILAPQTNDLNEIKIESLMDDIVRKLEKYMYYCCRKENYYSLV